MQSEIMKKALRLTTQHATPGIWKTLKNVHRKRLPVQRAGNGSAERQAGSGDLLKYRHFEDHEGADGLDSVRHNLRWFKNTNLNDSRLIICSMEGPLNYPDIDKLLVEDEFSDLVNRVVITAEPSYLARLPPATR